MTALVDLLHPVRAWDRDTDTAQEELEATGAQAFVVAAHALAWRSSLLVILAAWIGVLVEAAPKRWPIALGVAACLGILVPQGIAMFITFPVAFFAQGETFFRGSHEARLRFGTSGFVFHYYGWRYAFRGRTRPWGALIREEQVARNPDRAGVHDGPLPRRNYWPE